MKGRMWISDHENKWMDLKKFILETDSITKESMLTEITRLEVKYYPKPPYRPTINVEFGEPEPPEGPPLRTTQTAVHIPFTEVKKDEPKGIRKFFKGK